MTSRAATSPAWRERTETGRRRLGGRWGRRFDLVEVSRVATHLPPTSQVGSLSGIPRRVANAESVCQKREEDL
jgi:hypothetical protein